MAEPKETILVVDDEKVVRTLLKRDLETAGYTVITAANGKEALHELSSGKIRVILLDVRMPEMTGIEVLKRIENISEYCIILITSSVEVSTIRDALKHGVYRYILKPFDEGSVVEKVGQCIREWRSHLPS